jgi:hypothetical protein
MDPWELIKGVFQMKNPAKIFMLANLVMVTALLLSACGAGKPQPTPTLSVAAVQTAAVGTFAAGLTQTAFAMPTGTATKTPTATATPTALPTAIAAVPTSSCYGLTGISDVTIPDNTPMVPGQTFTKTWLVRNSGTCPWTAGFKFAFTSGNAMGGTTLVLDKAVSPGAQTNLSIAMTAPALTGSVRGNWRMSTLTGVFFGDEEYIIITLSGTATATATPAAPTATPAAPTATPIPSNTPTQTATP